MRFLSDKSHFVSKTDRRTAPRGCRRLRQRCLMALATRLGPDARWVQRHLDNCPRCRRRMAGWRRVELAFSALKSQSHGLDLLRQANSSAVKMLAHDLREAAQAEQLARVQAEPTFLERSLRYRRWATNAAACFILLILAKSGLFSSLDRFNHGSEKFVRNYYASQAGDDLAEELFDV